MTIRRASIALLTMSIVCGMPNVGFSQERPVIKDLPAELTLTSDRDYANPYVDVELSVTFKVSDGAELRRPAFWDGGRTWRVRVAAPSADGRWTWVSSCSNADDRGLHGQSGTLAVRAYTGDSALLRHGLLKMSSGRRNVLHADGTPFLVVGDTAWSLPWRATPETITTYAADRQAKGFNAVLLMSVQPDRDARGPRDRRSPQSFDVGFEDLPDSHINQLNPGYFQYVDGLIGTLVSHGIVPVWSPLFQGYGWKGKRSFGVEADPVEYARYCRYLVARYGAWPAMWLASADGTGLAACVAPGGEAFHTWDAYAQPTGIHYDPADGDPTLPEFKSRTAVRNHLNRSHQDAQWNDFQWCQTGHHGSHNVSKVRRMHDEQPTKAVANGEPTYEGIREPTNASGWWQGNEAWTNLTEGGSMGVVYGVAALWQWKFDGEDMDWPEWARDGCTWRSALDKEGAVYVGLISRAFRGYDFLDMTRHPDLAGGNACLAIPGKFYVTYLPAGGEVTISGLGAALPYRWFNPRDGRWAGAGTTAGSALKASAPDGGPWVLFVGKHSD